MKTQLLDLLAAPAQEVAPQLLGAFLSANGVTLRLVEVEAYGGVGEDPASHAFRGITARTAPMFGPPGTLYIYFTYGMHWCINIVCAPVDTASAVLVRAGEVVSGLEVARQRARVGAKDHELASGPARAARVLGLDGAANGSSLLGNGLAHLTLVEDAMLMPDSAGKIPHTICNGPRIGITKALDLPWRFWLADSPTVSRYRLVRKL